MHLGHQPGNEDEQKAKDLQGKVGRQYSRQECNYKVADVVVEAEVEQVGAHADYKETYAHSEGRSTLRGPLVVVQRDITSKHEEENRVSQNCENADAQVCYVV